MYNKGSCDFCLKLKLLLNGYFEIQLIKNHKKSIAKPETSFFLVQSFNYQPKPQDP